MDNTKIISLDQRLRNETQVKKDMLWPCYAYRVALPKKSSSDINIFENVILRLIQLGYSSVEQFSKLTCLEPELVAFIYGRLEQRGYLENNVLTDRATRELNKDAETSYQSVTILQNAINGKLLPYVSTMPLETKYIDAIGRNKLTFIVDPQKGRKVTANFIKHKNNRPIPPNAKEVLRVIKKASSDVRWLNIEDQITVQPNPEPIYLHCKMVVQAGNSDFFLVSDGLGNGGYSDDFADYLRKNQKEFKWVNDFQLKGVTTTDTNKKTSNEAGQYPEVTKRIKNIEKLINNWSERKNDSTDGENTYLANKKKIIVQLFEALEWTLSYMLHPLPKIENIEVGRTAKDVADWVTKKATNLGFKLALYPILQMDEKKIMRQQDTFSSPELAPLLVLAILGADTHTEHPLHNSIINQYPDFIEACQQIKWQRDKVAHGESAIDLELIKIREDKEKFVAIFYLLIPDLKKELSADNQKDTTGTQNSSRLEARLAVETSLGSEFTYQLNDEIRSDLINCQLAFMTIKKEEKTSGELDLMLAALLEKVLRTINKKLLRRDNPTAVNIRKLAKTGMVQAEFYASISQLPDVVDTIADRFLEQAYSGRGGTLGANLLVLCAQADLEDLKMLKAKFKELNNPPENLNILDIIFDVAKRRGHGSRQQKQLKPSEIDDLGRVNRNVGWIIKSMLEVFHYG